MCRKAHDSAMPKFRILTDWMLVGKVRADQTYEKTAEQVRQTVLNGDYKASHGRVHDKSLRYRRCWCMGHGGGVVWVLLMVWNRRLLEVFRSHHRLGMVCHGRASLDALTCHEGKVAQHEVSTVVGEHISVRLVTVSIPEALLVVCSEDGYMHALPYELVSIAFGSTP
jgi:hypothetical protein